MSDLLKLKQRRARIKGHLTRSENSLASQQGISAAEAQVRLKKIEDYFDEFQEVQDNIDEFLMQGEEEQKAFDEDNEAERTYFEERYYAVAAKAQKIIQDERNRLHGRRMRQEEMDGQEDLERPNTIRVETSHVRRNRPKLPEIKLLEFDGDWTKWLFWRNSFQTTILNDPDLSWMQKQQYLVGLLKGEPLKVVQGFDINEENCQIVWKLLCDTYNNEMILLESHMDELFNFPAITKENKAQSIKALVWHINTHMQALKTLGQPTNHWDNIIIHLAKKKLDYLELKEWQDEIKGKTPNNMPTLEQFIKFLTDRSHTLRMLNQGKEQNSSTTGSHSSKQIKDKKNEMKSDKRVFAATTAVCKYCEGEHHISRCEEFLKLNPLERKRQAMEKRLCLNCLKTGHLGRDCYSSTCIKCKEKHNTLLHWENPERSEDKSIINCCTEDPSAPVILYCARRPASQVILSTAQVHTFDSHGRKITCRALLDPGSQVNLITQRLARILKLPYSKEIRAISGIQQSHADVTQVMRIKLTSTIGEYQTDMECLVLPSITEQLPQAKIDINKVMVPKNISLADPTYHEPGNIDLLIGAGLFWKIIGEQRLQQVEGQPAWQNTKLGWIVGGEIEGTGGTGSSTSTSCFKVTNSQLNEQLERFWVQETLPEIKHYSKEEKFCEQQFTETVQQDAEGRFIVRLPLRPEVMLGESRLQAFRRLQSIERRFKKNQDLARSYAEFMDDYVAQGHMNQVTDESLERKESYFIPHQPVIRPDSITTKLRVVFDASAKSSLGTSLNDKLLPGPNLQGDLFSIILRFRTHEVVLTGDIAQMYRQILIHPEDRRYQLILWRENTNEQVKVYQLNTVTYGTACAPFHALRCLQELAQQHQRKYPLAAAVIKNDIYMDDALTGGKTIEHVQELQRQLFELLLKGKFLMRKWRSNHHEVLENLKSSQHNDELLVLDKQDAIKTLGLLWNARQDTLQYQVTLSDGSTNTKRSILSKISQIFDPLGLLSPILIIGKLFMQKLWSSDLDWDEELPEDYYQQWNSYYMSLPKLNELIITRNVNPQTDSDKIDIHGFGDASEKAFGACVYVVSYNEKKRPESHLLCSKSKVAPTKSVSVPRLELEAALLLSNLISSVKAALGEKVGAIHLWSDSTVVLGWIHTEPNRLKTFVANRVAKIQEKTEQTAWRHVCSADNPADLISRGTDVENIENSQLWWHGPHWLCDRTRHPGPLKNLETNLPEMKTVGVALVLTWPSTVLARFFSFRELCRVIAYCYRFIDNCRKQKLTGTLSIQELKRAEKIAFKWIQMDSFTHERDCLEKQKELPKKSPLRSLSAFLDEDGLIRVGGRLTNADITEAEKHPIVIPSKNIYTKVILQEEHKRLKHCPPGQLLHSLRQRVWPLNGRREAQAIIRKCLKCFKFRPRIPEVLMGDLPAERVKAFSRPFSTTGVDYAGPMQVRESRRKGRVHVSKAYVAVFICLSTKAVHLELVTDMTTKSFLAALSRFTARRGICSKMYSDNGTNFVGAARELRELYDFLALAESEITSSLKEQKIEWHFSPPIGPNFGGLWEAAVKMTKRHLLTITQGNIYTFEEYYTLLTEIEAILNSRPLTPLSEDPNDLSALTPSHFLVGDSLIQPVCSNFLEIPDNRLSRWEHLQKLRQQFWQRWQKEYLQELQKRTKWRDPGLNIKLNTLVLLIDDNTSPLYWPMGRIIAIHPGKDGITRVATVRTAKAIFKRPVRKLCPLPLNDDEV